MSYFLRDEYGKLITEYKPVNLAAGYQDFPIRDHVKKALVNIANGNDYLVHQYTQDYVNMHIIYYFISLLKTH